MSKFSTFINILDVLRKEAPQNYKFYHPIESDSNKLNAARSRAFIHLYLKVKFGLLTFNEREEYVTDGPNDGGVDGYYINNENKIIYFLQAKFRTSKENFESREIKFEELVNMDIDRITEGEKIDDNGTQYNGKVLNLINDLQQIPDIGRYRYEVVIMANSKGVSQNKLKKLSDGNRVTEFNFEKSYNELVFPVISGTFYNSEELAIYLNLEDKNSEDISYSVETEFKECEISVLFVPTIEIAKTLHKYKNSILKFNPRSYLDMAKGSVNAEIANTIISKTTNEFALFNNGITALSDETNLNKKIGKKGVGQLILKNPQIINGGQTAYTLSRLYEDTISGKRDKKIFDKKEVLLKVITFSEESNSNGNKLKLIEAISKATNQQTAVTEADRRSNDKIQLDLQEYIFNVFGLFYQRKAGEFGEGLKHNYIDRNQIIDRELILRLILARKGQPSQARSRGTRTLFKKVNFQNILNDNSKFNEYVFAYFIYQKIVKHTTLFKNVDNNKDGIVNYGHALRYGKFSVITAIMKGRSLLEFENLDKIIEYYLSKWLEFEEFIISQNSNQKYFREYEDFESGKMKQILNFDGYYKGTTINQQILNYQFEK